MYFDSKLVKQFLILLFIIAVAFVGYQILSDSEVEELASDSVSEEPVAEGAEYEIIEGEPVDLNDEADLEVSVSGDSVKIEDVVDDQYGNTIQFDNSFEHTKPGEFSEIIVNASGLEADEFTIVYIRKAGTEEYIEAGGQEHTADSEGNISARFTITEFGEYEVFLSSQGESHVSPKIIVK